MVDHIYINRYEKELERKKRAGHGGGPGPKDDKSDFVEVQRHNINEIFSYPRTKSINVYSLF